ncbi:MAG: O-methyltransferase [Acidobacteriota bacterium]|jgi:predicted O-methyltransferase YrrM
MSEHTTLLTKSLLRYLAERTTPEDVFLKSLKHAALELDEEFPAIWIAPEQGSFLQILLRLAGAREVIEIGTAAGYSAIWMARALPADGHVRTIEISGKRADFADKWVRDSDVAAKIRIFRGAAEDILPKFKDGSADVMFLDANRACYPLYLRHALRLVRTGGLILADNAFVHGALLANKPASADAEAMRTFNEIIANETALQSIIVPLGDGLWVAVKL